MTEIVTLPVASLETCTRVRVRHQAPKINGDKAQEYAEAYECGLITEPLDVFREAGTERNIVADGEHRLLGLRRAKIEEVECRLHEGDEMDALDFALGCNQAHGQPRTKADRYYSFVRIMETPLRDKYRTDSELAEKLGVSVKSIQRYRAEWRNTDGGDQEAKEQAKADAAKTTPKNNKGLGEGVDNCPPSERPKGPTLTDEQKRIAKQVRDSEKAKKQPKTMDEVHAEEAQQAIDIVRQFPHDGHYAAVAWPSVSTEQAQYMATFWAEFVAERDEKAQHVA